MPAPLIAPCADTTQFLRSRRLQNSPIRVRVCFAATTSFAFRHDQAASEEVVATADAETDAGWCLYLSAIPWRSQVNRQQELARQLAQTRQVLFVEPPGLLPFWRLRSEQLTASLWRLRPPTLLPLGRFLPPANEINRRLAAWAIRRWLGGPPGPRVVWTDEDLAAPLIGRLGATARIYDAADFDWTFTRRWNRWHLRRALASAVAGSDLVLVSSPALSAGLPEGGPRPVEVLNACDADHFRRDGSEPERLAPIPHPRLGYVGSIDERAFDAPLVASVARLRPDWSFVLCGRADPPAVRRLDGLANVHLLGPIDYADVPSFLRGFDVCLIPYRTDGPARYVHPKKLYEYLAVGKPVVATPLAALSKSDAPHRSAATAEEFVIAVEEALAERTCDELAERRRSIAAANSWDARGRTIRALVDGLERDAT